MSVYNKYIIHSGGCESERTGEYLWPVTALGEFASVECPCYTFLGSLAGTVSRYCGGDHESGARWDEFDDSQCAVLSSQVTARLCEAALVSSLCPCFQVSHTSDTLHEVRSPFILVCPI